MSSHDDHEGCGAHGCGASHNLDAVLAEEKLKDRMGKIKLKILVLSGKGGVGKSTVAVNLAASLAAQGYKTGLLDVDVHGPSVPTMLGLEDKPVFGNDHGGLMPVEHQGMKVMSIGFLMPKEEMAVIWRGPLKNAVIGQFLADVEWGDLDVLVIDAPPGTGDEPLTVAQKLPEAKALLITTPQRVANVDVKKSILFCKQLDMNILGLVENMAGVVCTSCGNVTQLFPSGWAAKLADEMHVPLLASLPIMPELSAAADEGRNLTQITGAAAVRDAFGKIIAEVKPLLAD